ncbi:hypothetical protein GGR57DRAFT_238253 [Xylariaceae sp. FL1272]|nr:hypothetical protein GGR57DRAFT_238253 [Xylariaceae sp. FL1272]
MASPAVALANGVPSPSPMHLDANPNANPDLSPSITATTKRKRDSTDDGDKQENSSNGANTNNASTPALKTDWSEQTPSSTLIEISNDAVRDYYTLLERLDTTPSLLKRPLPQEDPNDEPQAKRQKSVDSKAAPSIADKVAQQEYHDVNSFLSDMKQAVDDQLTELQHAAKGEDASSADSAIARVLEFKKKVHGIFERELSYSAKEAEAHKVLELLGSNDDLQSNASGNIILSVYGDAPKSRMLFSSLQQPTDGTDTGFRPLREIGLPNGIKVAKAIPYSFPNAIEKDKKSKTLGELFPAPRNLPSLPPPKAPKSTTKGLHVGWHRPELTEKSKYRAGSYSSHGLSTGKWLDYSSAAPSSQSMTKERERALSLAGNKPSSLELEATELESLFRGAFSSFAPSKDDSAAMVSSELISHTLWWQKVGQRSYDRLIGADGADANKEESEHMGVDEVEEIDEELIQRAIDNWDETVVDPTLEELCCPRKSDEEKDVDDILQDVSDMIQTLISYQRNRNLTLPTASSQSRYAADPSHSDMLTNGSPVQPGEEEMATYEALKAQLALVINMLPPYAVARVNSDKLEELDISMKLEIRTEEYQGIMEEDNGAARSRTAVAQSTAPPPNPRPVSHRSSSSSSTVNQYGQQYHPNAARGPVPTPPFYPSSTPVRPPQSSVTRVPQTMPPAYQQRPPSNAGGYRPPSGYNTSYTPQYSKPAPPYSQQPSFTSTPTQSRPPTYTNHTGQNKYVPGYHNMGRLGNQPPQQPRYQASYQAPHTQPPQYNHQNYQAQQSPAPPPSQINYGPFTNGVGAMPPRTTPAPQHTHYQQPHSPHVPPQQVYHTAGTPSRQPSYGGQPQMNNQSRPYYPPAGTHVPPVQNNQMANQHYNPTQPGQSPGQASFQTSLNTQQVQQAMDQAQARFNAQQTAQKPTEYISHSVGGYGQGAPSGGFPGAPVGLGGIGLGSDPSRMASARTGKPFGNNYSQSSPNLNGRVGSPAAPNAPPPMNGSPAPVAPMDNSTQVTSDGQVA